MKCTCCVETLKKSAWAVCYMETGCNAPIHVQSLKELEEQSVFAKPAFQYKVACSLRCVAAAIREIRAGSGVKVNV